MSRASVAAENNALNGLDASASGNLIGFVALHSGDPGTTGANELSGGGYARQACTWNPASNGTKTNATALTFTNAGTAAVGYASAQSAASAGTYGMGIVLASSVTAATITVAAGALSLSAS